MYLPKSKYKPAKYTTGNKFLLPDGTYYTGWYVETYRGEYITGKLPNSSSSKLIEESQNEGKYPKSYKFANDIIIPTDKNYIEGTFKRYFVQDKRTNAIIEVNLEKYKYFKKQRYVNTVYLDWILKGPSENINKGVYVYFGASSKNKTAVEEAEKTIKGLSSIIKSYSQFVK